MMNDAKSRIEIAFSNVKTHAVEIGSTPAVHMLINSMRRQAIRQMLPFASFDRLAQGAFWSAMRERFAKQKTNDNLVTDCAGILWLLGYELGSPTNAAYFEAQYCYSTRELMVF